MAYYENSDRKAYFSQLRKGTRGVYSESQLIIPALILLSESKTRLSTSQLIQRLQKLLRPTGHDEEIISGRKDTYFTQKVRNLKFHDTLASRGLATYKYGLWKITEKGSVFLEESEYQRGLLHAQGFSPKKIEKESDGDYSRIVIEEGALEFRTSKQRKRSQKLKQVAIEEFKKIHENKLLCEVCEFSFPKCYGNYGKDYIEIHHIEPVHLNDIRGAKILLIKALKKVVPLCSNCHRMVHRKKGKMLSVAQLKQIVNENRI
jgi:predicted HNH restriction endonuclease